MSTELWNKYEPESNEVTEFIWSLLPSIYKEPSLSAKLKQADVDRLRKFSKSLDYIISHFRLLINDSSNWDDPKTCPIEVLPYLASIVGVDFNYDLPEEYAREEVDEAIDLWRNKGTRYNIIKQVVKSITGYNIEIREFYLNVMRSNVFGEAYPENVTQQMKELGLDYHLSNTWQDPTNHSDTPFYGSMGGDYLYRNHIAIFIDADESDEILQYYNSSYRTIKIEKLGWYLKKVVLFGIVYHIIWRTKYDESYTFNIEEIDNLLFNDTSIEYAFKSGIPDNVLFSNWFNDGMSNTMDWLSYYYVPVVDDSYYNDDIVSLGNEPDWVLVDTLDFEEYIEPDWTLVDIEDFET